MRRGAPSTQRLEIRGDCCRARSYRQQRFSSPVGMKRSVIPIRCMKLFDYPIHICLARINPEGNKSVILFEEPPWMSVSKTPRF
ncbi:MAG: hypothetical protein ACTSYG_11630, partial [Candidatus Heimdallarchaeota archaeon]